MSNLAHRTNTIFKANSTDSTLPNFAESYTVTAYENGAVANGAGTTNTPTVRAGHGFEAGDKFIVGTDTTKYHAILSVAATQLTLDNSETETFADGDLIVNLGADTGTTTPSYDASGASIYDTPDSGASAISNSRVTASDLGEYAYWSSEAEIWELVRDSDGTPVDVVPDVTRGDMIAPGTSTDNAIARFDGTSGKLIQDYTSGAPTVSDTGAVTIPTTCDVTGDVSANDITCLDITARTIDLSSTANVAGLLTAEGNLTVEGGTVFETSLAHQGTTAGFYNATPVVQPADAGETTGYSAVGGTNVDHQDTFTGNVGSAAYTINDIVKALKNLGLMDS